MNIFKNLSKATVGAAVLALGVGTATLANAASLDFSFTTESGGTGSFTLDTDTTPDPDSQVLSNFNEEGLVYTGAVSNFSFSSPATSFSDPTSDFLLVLSVSSPPDIRGILSFVAAPSGLGENEFPLAQLDLGYLGNPSELPVLSDDPSSYSSLNSIQVFDSLELTANTITDETITESQVVPEPSSVLGTIAFGIGGAGLLLKRQMNRKNQQ